MKQRCFSTSTISAVAFVAYQFVWAGQAPDSSSAPDVPISHHDRVYAAEQFSNTVSVIDPAENTLLGVIRLGDPSPGNMSPLYRGQVLVHGMSFSPDHRLIAVVSIGTNSVSFIETQTNTVKHVTYVGRAPHEVFFTPDGKEVWVTIRGENYVSVLDGKTFEEKGRIVVANGPGMQIFSPDGKYGYVCSSFTAETDVISVADHTIVGKVTQASPFCPNIAATPDGQQVWFTLKDTGKVQVFDATPPFALLKTIDTGPITNHVNFVRNTNGQFAYVTVGALNQVKVFRTDDFTLVATIPVGNLPHGIWPSGDGKRPHRPGATGGCLRTERRDGGRRQAKSPGAQCGRPGYTSHTGTGRIERIEHRKCADHGRPLRSGLAPGLAGIRQRTFTETTIYFRACRYPRRQGCH